VSTLLIVDDERPVSKLLGKIIEKEGFRVVEAGTGKECLDLYRESQPDIALIDIVMPDKDGISTIKELKSLNHQAKIIAMSGGLVFTPQAYLDEATEVGADFVFSKPIDNKLPMSAIKDLL